MLLHRLYCHLSLFSQQVYRTFLKNETHLQNHTYIYLVNFGCDTKLKESMSEPVKSVAVGQLMEAPSRNQTCC